jgi:hypothetical protein
MRKILLFTIMTALAAVDAVQASAAETNLVQHLSFNLTAWYQGPTVTNGSIIISNANSRTIVTKQVITWLGQATTNSFTNASLLIIKQLGVTNPLTRFVVREKIKGVTTSVDVTPFFLRTFGAPEVASTSLNTTNGALNGTFYGGVAFRLQDNSNYPALKGHFDVGGFRVTTFTSLQNKHHQLIGETEQGSVRNAFGKGDFVSNGTTNLFTAEGSITINGQVQEVDLQPLD